MLCSSYLPKDPIFLQYRTTNILIEEKVLEIHNHTRTRETAFLILKFDKNKN
jgi:hypothetical protein